MLLKNNLVPTPPFPFPTPITPRAPGCSLPVTPTLRKMPRDTGRSYAPRFLPPLEYLAVANATSPSPAPYPSPSPQALVGVGVEAEVGAEAEAGAEVGAGVGAVP
jgi:hypothetical protein